jgi:hypothetical protein
MNAPYSLKSLRYATLILLSILCSPALASTALDTEKKIISLSENWADQVIEMTNSSVLKAFCRNDVQQQSIFSLLDEIHYHHDVLEEELRSTTFNHSRRYITRILKHMDKLDEKYHPDEFAEFFGEQCLLQTKIEKKSHQYRSGFGGHSYTGKVYAQEVVTYRYLKRLTKRISRIKKNVEHFYMRRLVWES